MKMNTSNKTLDPQTLADDLSEVCRINAQFFARLAEPYWDKPIRGSSNQWNLHETVAHLCALNGDGLQSIKNTLRGEPYTFVGLENCYQLKAFNRKGIDDHLDIPMKELCAELLGILDDAASIARDLQPDQAELTAQMPIYNRPSSPPTPSLTGSGAYKEWTEAAFVLPARTRISQFMPWQSVPTSFEVDALRGI